MNSKISKQDGAQEAGRSSFHEVLAELEAELKFSGEQADKSCADQNQYWRGRLHGAHKALDTARRCSANDQAQP